MKKFFSRIANFSRKTKLIVAAASTLVVIGGTVAVFAGSGPDRPTFDWNVDPGGCRLDDTNHGDRCGSMTGPVFNSFIHTPSYGDERNFATIAEVNPGQAPNDASYTDSSTAQAGKEYWVRALVHNDANQNTNCDPSHIDPAKNDCTQVDPGSKGIATGTNVRFEVPQGPVSGVDMTYTVGASNATPTSVFDTATLANANLGFAVSYVNGSAVLYNGAHQSGLALPDAIAGANGTAVGYNDMNGSVPGCFDFSAYVYVKVRVDVSQITLKKQVRLPGDTQWHDAVDAKPGQTVQWLIDVTNTGSDVAHNMIASDLLPPHLTYVNGTAKWYSAEQNGVAYDFNQLIINQGNGGYNFGNYVGDGGGFLVRFDTVVNGDFDACDITISNVAHARSTEAPTELTDIANVHITKENCQASPSFSCNLFDITKGDHAVTISQFQTSANNGATFKDVTINWNDNSPSLVTNSPIGKTHSFSGNGPFNITATARFTVNGQDQTAPIGSCAKVVSFTTPTTPTPTPTPTALPNTGPGDVLGIFAAVSLAGGLFHRYILGRRFN